jgi:hypothetical protein
MVAAPFIPMRPHTIFNNDLISFNSFGTSLAQDASRSPNAHSEPGPSLTPPAMPARAESPPDFIRGFGLDAPDGAEEEQAVTEVHEAWPMVPQVSHIAVSDADDTVDMELDEEDEFQEDASGSRNGNSNNASSAEEDEGEVRQIRHAVRNGGSLGEIFGHASRPSLDDTYSSTIEERLEALLENKLDGFREEVRALWAESLSTSRALHDKTSELLALYQDILSRLMTVPGSAGASMKVAKLTDAELLAHTVTEEEQSIATKVRAQDDAVRAEKDIMLERLASEHDQLCATVDEIQSVMILRATEATTLLTVERDETPSPSLTQFKTPSPSLTQFKTPDVTTESQQERILEPGNLNQEFEAGEQVPVSKASSVPVEFLYCGGSDSLPNRCTLTKRRLASRRAIQTRPWTRTHFTRVTVTTFDARTSQSCKSSAVSASAARSSSASTPLCSTAIRSGTRVRRSGSNGRTRTQQRSRRRRRCGIRRRTVLRGSRRRACCCRCGLTRRSVLLKCVLRRALSPNRN